MTRKKGGRKNDELQLERHDTREETGQETAKLFHESPSRPVESKP
jgi:hypothetical protein